MKKLFWLLLLSFVSLFIVSCDDESDDGMDTVKPVLSVTDLKFSDGYKTFKIYGKLQNTTGLGDVFRADSLSVCEFDHHGSRITPSVTAKVVDVKNIGAHLIDSIGVKLLVVVDLTLPQNLVDSQRTNVLNIARLYNSHNLYISFIHADSVSSSYLVSEYIVNNYFISESDTLTSKKLYRSIYDKYLELNDSTTAIGSNEYSAMVFFSDGNVYGMDATPIDPEHYQLQSDILKEIGRLGRPFYYFNLDNSAVGAVNDAANFLQLVAEKSGGAYMNRFDWSVCENALLDVFGIRYNDFVITLENQDDRIYDGKNRLQIFLNANDTSFLLVDTSFSVGTVCKPVIIDGIPQIQVVLQGIMLAIILIILIYVSCQLVIPYILNRIFRKRHTTTYVGPNTTLNGVAVGDVCYLCKTPFNRGDRVVAKCAHTMHESCWKENDYHCTEYGRRCKHGSHYYNSDDLFDPKNALFYTLWLIAAVVIALIAWIGFILYDQETTYNFMIEAYSKMAHLKVGSAEYVDMVGMFDRSLDQLPSFGAFLGFVFTFCIGLMVSLERLYLRKVIDLIGKSIVSGICGYMFFLIGLVVTIVLDIKTSSLAFDWFPWTATALTSVFLATYRTKMKPKGKWFFGMLFVGIFSMFLWDVIFSSNSSDYRLMLFISNLVFSLGLVLSVAAPMSASENYVLHISGCIKEMDVAINKWFKQSASSRVTIGRSIDCGIQTSWDIQGNVAAVHAEVISYRRQLYLIPLEDGVYMGNKMLKTDRRYRLYHGRCFTIGTTTFTFLERDLH